MKANKVEGCLKGWEKWLMVREHQGCPRNRVRGKREAELTEQACCCLSAQRELADRSVHRIIWVFPSQMSWFPVLVLQKRFVWNKFRVPEDRHPPAAQRERWEAPGRTLRYREHPALFSAAEQPRAGVQRGVEARSDRTYSQWRVPGKSYWTMHGSACKFNPTVIISWTSKEFMHLIPLALCPRSGEHLSERVLY